LRRVTRSLLAPTEAHPARCGTGRTKRIRGCKSALSRGIESTARCSLCDAVDDTSQRRQKPVVPGTGRSQPLIEPLAPVQRRPPACLVSWPPTRVEAQSDSFFRLAASMELVKAAPQHHLCQASCLCVIHRIDRRALNVPSQKVFDAEMSARNVAGLGVVEAACRNQLEKEAIGSLVATEQFGQLDFSDHRGVCDVRCDQRHPTSRLSMAEYSPQLFSRWLASQVLDVLSGRHAVIVQGSHQTPDLDEAATAIADERTTRELGHVPLNGAVGGVFTRSSISRAVVIGCSGNASTTAAGIKRWRRSE
jgi:hypothetical protein